MAMSAPNAIGDVGTPPNPVSQMIKAKQAEQAAELRDIQDSANNLFAPPSTPALWSQSSFVNGLSTSITNQLFLSGPVGLPLQASWAVAPAHLAATILTTSAGT